MREARNRRPPPHDDIAAAFEALLEVHNSAAFETLRDLHDSAAALQAPRDQREAMRDLRGASIANIDRQFDGIRRAFHAIRHDDGKLRATAQLAIARLGARDYGALIESVEQHDPALAAKMFPPKRDRKKKRGARPSDDEVRAVYAKHEAKHADARAAYTATVTELAASPYKVTQQAARAWMRKAGISIAKEPRKRGRILSHPPKPRK